MQAIGSNNTFYECNLNYKHSQIRVGRSEIRRWLNFNSYSVMRKRRVCVFLVLMFDQNFHLQNFITHQLLDFDNFGPCTFYNSNRDTSYYHNLFFGS